MNADQRHTDDGHGARLDEMLRERIHDPYRMRAKLSAPAACGDCGAVYDRGGWTWKPAPEQARQIVCPACRRIRDRVPAGILTLTGDFITWHGDEIRALVHNVATRARARHPLKRIIDWAAQPDGIVITVTDPRLARAIGVALNDAYDGELQYQYTREEYLLRVRWSRST